ncbi:MAG: hypothetical protein GQ570_03565 [Helicobacteraceae bacterium]|nr:hypothetical protein [Helicobacteraceae bacterium]
MKQQPATKDPRKVEYLETTTLDEAFDRTEYLFKNYDNVWFAYSGGKDSQVCLEVADIVLKRLQKEGVRPPEEKVNVYFRDEEVIPPIVWETCADAHQSGRWNFRYYAIPMASRKFVLGELVPFTMWDLNREHIRTPPEFAITSLYDKFGEVVDTSDLTQKDMDHLMFYDLKGSTVLCTGVRADESLARFGGVMANKSERCWLGTSAKQHIAKPIYDWTEIDIFKFMYDYDIEYCKTYNDLLWSGRSLRVSSSLHEMNSIHLDKLKGMYPEYYHQIIQIFPEMESQTRYWKDYNSTGALKMYDPSFDGLRKYCHDKVGEQPDLLAKYLHYVGACEKARNNKIERQGHAKNLGGYPILYVFNNLLKGSWFKDGASPMKDMDISPEHHEYERGGI